MANFVKDAAKSKLIPKLKENIQNKVITELAPVIQKGLNNIDELKKEINTKLGIVSTEVKGLVPDFLRKEVDVTMVTNMVDSIDSSVFKTEFDKIIDNLTDEDIAKAGSKKEDLKTQIGGLPDDIKDMLKTHINDAFPKATGANDAKATGTEVHVKNADTNGAVDENYKITSVEAANILEELKKTLGDNVFNSLIDAASAIKAKQGSNGVEYGPEANNDASEKPSTEAAETKTEAAETKTEAEKPTTEAEKPTTEAEKPTTEAAETKTEAADNKTDAAETKTEAEKPSTTDNAIKTEAAETKTEAAETKTEVAATTTTEADSKGGAKKRRRKTKKNIRRPKKSYTKFDRKF
jgi:hypothetical protein